MKILVTGGAGYLGSVLSLALIEEGHNVRVLDNLMYGGRSLLSMFGHSRFDFWLGEWDVRDPAGKLVGHNRIESAHAGCALVENWRGQGGVTGTSVNVYDRDRARWHQTWVDSGGGLLQLDGGIVGAAMVLEGDAVDADAPRKVTRQRVTWTPQADGGVRQLWEASSDDGATWKVVFDGRYTRKR